VSECAGKWLHDLKTKRAASVNATRCKDREEEEEGCFNMLRCDRTDNVLKGRRTPDASWMEPRRSC
jgi:hypothetical protein